MRHYTEDETLPGGGKRIHVRRCCNGCGRDIGDVTTGELDAAQYGYPLPDVTGECGCAGKPVRCLYEVGKHTPPLYHVRWPADAASALRRSSETLSHAVLCHTHLHRLTRPTREAAIVTEVPGWVECSPASS